MVKKLNRSFPIERGAVQTSAADTLKETLDYYKVTQKEFALRIGVSQKYVSELLNRKVYMNPEIAKRIAIVTGISADFLLRMDASYILDNLSDNAENGKKEYLQPFDWAVPLAENG